MFFKDLKLELIMLPNNELFVDTGIHTGWAFFQGTIKPETGTIFLAVNERKTLENYIRFYGDSFQALLFTYQPFHVTIEHPEFWVNSQKSKTAITNGSLFHLAANAYTYADRCSVNNIPFTLVTANHWKGNLSKEATELRVKRINGTTYENDHITDAVAMGLIKDKDIWNLKRI